MKNLFKQLEKESDSLDLSTGRKASDQFTDALPTFQKILEHCKENPRDAIQILEAVEEATSRQPDSRYPNPNDRCVFVLIRLLKMLRWKHQDDSSRLHIAEKAAENMINSRFSISYRCDLFIENLYDLSEASRSEAMDELYDIIPVWVESQQWDKLNEAIKQIDLSRLYRGTMYGLVHMVCYYIDYLPDYPAFWQRIYDEFTKRCTDPDAKAEDMRTTDQIDDLLLRWKDGPGMHEKHDSSKPRPDYTSPEEQFNKKVEAKREWAIAHGDTELADMLKWYNDIRLKAQNEDATFRRMRSRYGDKEYNKMAAEALRAMADKIEQPGMHFITSCVIPTIPIFGDKTWPADWFSHIEVSLMKGPVGG